MKRPSKDSDEANRFPQAADELSASSHRPAAGETVIQFPSPAASAGAREDAGVSSASASSTFVPLSVPVRAVVMRLQGRFPKVNVMRDAAEGGAPAASLDDQREGEDR
jgi:hypothetical protein